MRKHLVSLLILTGLLLQFCSDKAPLKVVTELNGIPLALTVPPGSDPPPLRPLLDELEKMLSGRRELDPDYANGLIAELNREANTKSVQFDDAAYDFILQVMALGRSTAGLIDLRTGALTALWQDAGEAGPDPAVLDSTLVWMQRSGFISASKSFLIYGPAADWNTTPLLPAWYADLAYKWLQGRLPQGLLRVGPVYMAIGELSDYQIAVELPCDTAAVKHYAFNNRCLAIGAAASQQQLVNPLTGQPAADCITSFVEDTNPVTALGMALAAELQPPVEAQAMLAAAEVSGAIIDGDGTITGSPELAARLQ